MLTVPKEKALLEARTRSHTRMEAVMERDPEYCFTSGGCITSEWTKTRYQERVQYVHLRITVL